MDENLNANATPSSANHDAHRELLAVWLSRLFLCQLAALAVSALSPVSALNAAIGWISRILTVVSIVILLKLSPASGRYRKAAIFRCIVVGGGIISLLLKSSILTLIWTVCNLLAQYQEYSAHSDLMAAKDPKLSKNWHALFNWQIFGGVIAAISSIFVILGAMLSGADSNTVTSITLWAVNAVTVILQIFYLTYLQKTLKLYKH